MAPTVVGGAVPENVGAELQAAVVSLEGLAVLERAAAVVAMTAVLERAAPVVAMTAGLWGAALVMGRLVGLGVHTSFLACTARSGWAAGMQTRCPFGGVRLSSRLVV